MSRCLSCLTKWPWYRSIKWRDMHPHPRLQDVLGGGAWPWWGPRMPGGASRVSLEGRKRGPGTGCCGRMRQRSRKLRHRRAVMRSWGDYPLKPTRPTLGAIPGLWRGHVHVFADRPPGSGNPPDLRLLQKRIHIDGKFVDQLTCQRCHDDFKRCQLTAHTDQPRARTVIDHFGLDDLANIGLA